MLEKYFGRKEAEEGEWAKLADRFRNNASLDELHYIVGLMADYDKEKLNRSLWEYACTTLEKMEMSPGEHPENVRSLMRNKFLQVGKKVYQFYKKKAQAVYIYTRESDAVQLANFESQLGSNSLSTFPWVVTSKERKSDKTLMTVISR